MKEEENERMRGGVGRVKDENERMGEEEGRGVGR